MPLTRILQKAAAGGRLSFADAKRLYREADLFTLAGLAQKKRFHLNPERTVTYAVDRNINYTNICQSRCRFCAFFRPNGHPEAYVLAKGALERKLQETRRLGGTHILFQGGLNPALDLEWHEEQIQTIRSHGLHVHGYSPPEILFFARQSGSTVSRVLRRLMRAGLGSIPGGGAEILVDRVRKTVSPKKATSRQWLSVMETAHGLGLPTTATMMFGHKERPVDRLVHLFRLRRLQDATGGFTAFILWPYQSGNRTLAARRTGAVPYLRLLALSRLVLDNFPHIQASWVTMGPAIGQTALHFGADDLGSTMIEENVVAAAGVSHRIQEEEMVRLIEKAGYAARKRDVLYQRVA